MTNTIMILAVTASLILGTIPLASAVSWPGVLEIGFPGSQIYEVSGVSVIPAGPILLGNIVELRCLEGDWFLNTNRPVFLVVDPSVDTTNLNIRLGLAEPIGEISPGVVDDLRIIGIDVRARQDGAIQLFDIPVTVTGLCVSPSPINQIDGDVGGLLIQPDTTALFLAYGIANAVWLAPTLAGIGAGIYLTKSKWKKN